MNKEIINQYLEARENTWFPEEFLNKRKMKKPKLKNTTALKVNKNFKIASFNSEVKFQLMGIKLLEEDIPFVRNLTLRGSRVQAPMVILDKAMNIVCILTDRRFKKEVPYKTFNIWHPDFDLSEVINYVLMNGNFSHPIPARLFLEFLSEELEEFMASLNKE